MKLSIFFNSAFAVTATFAVAAAEPANGPLDLLDNLAVRGVMTSRCPAPVTETVTQTICVTSPVGLPSSTTGHYNPTSPVVTSSSGNAPPEVPSYVAPSAPTFPTTADSITDTGAPPNSTVEGTPSPSGSKSGPDTTIPVSLTSPHSQEPSKPASTSSAPPTETTNAAALAGMGYSAGALAAGGVLLNAFMVAIV